MEREVKASPLRAGVYLVRALGGGVEKRTWLAITDVALLAKQSRQELLVFAAQARSGQPVAGEVATVLLNTSLILPKAPPIQNLKSKITKRHGRCSRLRESGSTAISLFA